MLFLNVKHEKTERLKTKVNITFSTPYNHDELTDMEMHQIEGTQGHLAYHDDELKSKVIDFLKQKEIGIDDKQRSKSKLMREVIYRLWEATETELTAEEYYIKVMDYYINLLCKELEKRTK